MTRADATPILVDERNLPAEKLAELVADRPWLATALAVAPPDVLALVDAASAREEEIIRSLHAAGMGAVVLVDGSVVPVEEAVQVGGKWFTREALLGPSPTTRRDRVLASILTLASMGMGMPIGLGAPSPSRQPLRLLHKPAEPRSKEPRSPAEVERRKRRKAQRKSRKGRK